MISNCDPARLELDGRSILQLQRHSDVPYRRLPSWLARAKNAFPTAVTLEDAPLPEDVVRYRDLLRVARPAEHFQAIKVFQHSDVAPIGRSMTVRPSDNGILIDVAIAPTLDVMDVQALGGFALYNFHAMLGYLHFVQGPKALRLFAREQYYLYRGRDVPLTDEQDVPWTRVMPRDATDVVFRAYRCLPSPPSSMFELALISLLNYSTNSQRKLPFLVHSRT